MAASTSRSGSLFSLGEVPPDALPQFLQSIRHRPSLKKSYRRLSQVLEAWFGLCAEADDGIVDRNTLCDSIDISRSGLIHNLKTLERLGMIGRSARRPHANRRRVTFFELVPPGQWADESYESPDLFDNPVVSISDAAAARLEERNALTDLFRHPDTVRCVPIRADKTTFKGERLTVFTLAPALNVGRRGTVTEKTTRIWRGNCSFEVTVRALTGHCIPNVRDLRTLVVAWTLARQQLEKMGDSVPQQPVFVMSLTDVCQHLGFAKPTATNKRDAFKCLRRFKSSEWHLTDDRYNLLRSFRQRDMLERDKYMSFIADLETVSTVCANGKTPDTVAIQFHPTFTPVLTDASSSLTLHDEYIRGKYNREFDQLVYQWCRTAVQHDHEPRPYALERVNREAHPSVAFPQFCEGLERMVADPSYERMSGATNPVLLIPGYAMAVDVPSRQLVVSARREDPHLGTTSKYALTKQSDSGQGGRSQSLPPSRAENPPDASDQSGRMGAPASLRQLIDRLREHSDD